MFSTNRLYLHRLVAVRADTSCLVQVAHGISTSGPLGPFERIGLAIPSEAHNPVLSRDPVDGTWLIWTCGCPHTPKHDDCTQETVSCPGGAPAQWTTTVYSSPSLDGPWTAHPDVLGNITRGRVSAQLKLYALSCAFSHTSQQRLSVPSPR